MIEKHKTAEASQNPNSGRNHIANSHLTLLLAVGIVAVAGLLLVSVFWPNLSERTKFFTGNLLNVIIATAVVAQVLINRKQWQVMERQWQAVKEQTKAMRDSFYIAERAYLTLEDVAFIEKGTYPRVVLTVFNGGRTPAFKVHTETEVNIGIEPASGKVITLGHPHGERAFLPAGTKKQMAAHFPNTPISMEHWNAINAGRETFFIRGVVFYDDFRGDTHPLPFTVGYDPSLNRFRDYKAEDENGNPN